MDWGQILSGLLGSGAQLGLANYGLGEVRQAGTDVQQSLANIAAQTQAGLQFKPYTVTTGGAGGGLGTFTAGPTGTQMALSPDYQNVVQQLTQAGVGGMLGAAAPIDQRAMDITQQLEAASAPQRQREQLALEQRLLGQGRLGVRTAQYGGTPEQLAFAKALEEQRMQNALAGRQQALGEQLQQYNIGQGMFGASFTPQQMLLNVMGAGVPYAELSTRAQQQQAVTGAELATAGAEARMQAEQQANALRQIYLQEALKGLFAPQYFVENGQVTSSGTLFSGLFDKVSGLFGGSSPDVSGLTAAQRAALNLP
jgi:hypothetical protein